MHLYLLLGIVALVSNVALGPIVWNKNNLLEYKEKTGNVRMTRIFKCMRERERERERELSIDMYKLHVISIDKANWSSSPQL